MVNTTAIFYRSRMTHPAIPPVDRALEPALRARVDGNAGDGTYYFWSPIR